MGKGDGMAKKTISIVVLLIYCLTLFANDTEIKKINWVERDKAKHELLDKIKKDKEEYIPPKDYLTKVGVSSAIFASSSIITMLFLGIITFSRSFNGGTDGYLSSQSCVLTPAGVGTIATLVYNIVDAKTCTSSVEKENVKRIGTWDMMAMESEKNANEWAFYWAGLLIYMIFSNSSYDYEESTVVLLPAGLLIASLLVVLVGRQTKSAYDISAFGKKFASEYNSELVKSTGIKRGTAYLYGSFTAMSFWMIGMTIIGLKTIGN
jgi:hypothetical protein